MGLFVNKGNEGFRQVRNSEYVDKSGLISVVNKTLFTEKKLSCVTRSHHPRTEVQPKRKGGHIANQPERLS